MIPKYSLREATRHRIKTPISSSTKIPMLEELLTTSHLTLPDEARELGDHIDYDPVPLVEHKLLVIVPGTESLETCYQTE